MTENSVTELPATPQYDLENGCQAGEGSCFKQSASEQVSGCLSNEKAIDKFQPTSENIQNEPVEVNDVKDQMQLVLAQVTLPQCDYRNGCQAGEGSCFKQIAAEQVSGCLSNEKSIDKFQPTTENIQNEPVEVNDVKDQMQLIPAQVTLSNGDEQLDPPSADVGKSTTSDCLGGKSGRATHNQLGRRKKITSKSLKKKYMLRSLCCNDRVLRSKTREKTEAPESNSNLANFRNDVENSRKERKKKKKKKPGEQMTDGFSRIRAHLKYFLNRVSYEQSLIDAYSGEGWKGYRCVHCTITITISSVYLVVSKHPDLTWTVASLS
ncbi:homeobox protein HAT3.1-like [Senna tora]|uniref:Homeobox protein HAT3.1-like n=1 Tax=Senna tora TaxID=362788 RepID=A0A834SWD6_9FABA|nr:homeobox protein HAT3.1-like [Senna tora]